MRVLIPRHLLMLGVSIPRPLVLVAVAQFAASLRWRAESSRWPSVAEITRQQRLDEHWGAYQDTLASAVVSINPANGAIRAMTGGHPGRKGYQFNLVAQARRQAGSMFQTPRVGHRGDEEDRS